MRTCFQYILSGFAVISLALPALARTDEMMLHLNAVTIIGNVQVASGDYQVKADEAKKDLKILKDDKVVADVQGNWVDLPKKPDYDQALIDGNRLIQVEFEGQIRSFVIG